MSDRIGKQVTVELFGESHGPAIGAVIEGLAPGIALDMEQLRGEMDKRRPRGRISTARQEADEVEFLSGVFQGRTTGTALCLVIRNGQQHSEDYSAMARLARPSHADFSAQAKYRGFQDYRGGGHFSGRLTAPLVAAGAICQQVLARHGVRVGTHIARLGGETDAAFGPDPQPGIDLLARRAFPTLDEATGDRMRQRIEAAAAQGDSLGGELETAVVGMPAGIGEPFFDSVESVLAHLLFSIPGVKGVSFGAGFALAGMRGSEANDPFYREGDAVRTRTNHSGGVNGGITNGMPLLIHCAVRPTPSIYQPQQTVDLVTGEEATLSIRGRHDPAIVHRARAVVDAMVAIGLTDLFARRYGYLWTGETACVTD